MSGLTTHKIQSKKVLTRSSGYLSKVTSHSLQPYRGCAFGKALCGVGCYVQHNTWITQGREWGSFLDVKENARACYRKEVAGERKWARENGDQEDKKFGIFFSSSTDPFLPQESKYKISQGLLEEMLVEPPDFLVVQTHTHRVMEVASLLKKLTRHCELRVHISIESDLDSLPGLPRPASSVQKRFEAVEDLRKHGLFTVVTVSPLLPIQDKNGFFAKISEKADAVVIDHFIGGDGSKEGGRTKKTALPKAMRRVRPESTELAYLEEVVSVARKRMPGRVGVGVEGFAGVYN